MTKQKKQVAFLKRQVNIPIIDDLFKKKLIAPPEKVRTIRHTTIVSNGEFTSQTTKFSEPKTFAYGLHAIQDRVMPVLFDVHPFAESGTVYTGTIYPYGLQGLPISSFQIPVGQRWQIVDMWVSSSDVDASIIFSINGIQQGPSGHTKAMVVSNSTRMRIGQSSQSIMMNPTDVFSIQIILNQTMEFSEQESLKSIPFYVYVHIIMIPV